MRLTSNQGPRTCIGRKFSIAEAVCFLTLLVRDWIIEPVMNPGETGEQWRERVMQADVASTLTETLACAAEAADSGCASRVTKVV